MIQGLFAWLHRLLLQRVAYWMQLVNGIRHLWRISWLDRAIATNPVDQLCDGNNFQKGSEKMKSSVASDCQTLSLR
jgi:hypothetical protein